MAVMLECQSCCSIASLNLKSKANMDLVFSLSAFVDYDYHL